jgi:2,3-bisphosphoglycerate-independent phosphoglycerate mutase
MENNNDDDSKISAKKIIPKPLVLVFIDSWGIAPKHSGNVFGGVKVKNFSKLIKDYPLALLKTEDTVEKRYTLLGGEGRLSQSISDAGLTQINITESEKLLDSWYHLSNKREYLLPGEDLKVISSTTGIRQDNSRQALPELLKTALNDIKKGLHDVIFLSLANLDLVSATGDFLASQEALKILDKSLGSLVDAVLKHDGVLIITAAYGHAESMINPSTELPQSGITTNPVPLLLISNNLKGKTIGLPDILDDDLSLIDPIGSLENIMPTILKTLNISIPDNLVEKSLV